MIYLELLLSFIKIGLLSIGGGYAAIPLIREEIVLNQGWLTMSEFADITTIAEMTPGPIAINSSTFVGIQVAGIPGALIATFGCILPSSIIVIFLAYLYEKYQKMTVMQGILSGLRPAVVAMIASAALSIIALSFFNLNSLLELPHYERINTGSIFLFALALLVVRKVKISPIYIIFGSGVIGLILSLIF